ncbi:NCS1 family nucleobase:cation symporter-1 [Acidithiobacillus sp. IBUN Pt1247-S3]|uniref:NCS1 family nucleobase:cation symporter-1 n=1 Tax=Acidithiobacillus sp. IBUN Pt1247-S3 TaxID=3166642 RepID=UPI0034E59C35
MASGLPVARTSDIAVPEGAGLEELCAEAEQSPLYNEDLAPIPESRRSWGTWNYAALWISMSAALTNYTLAAGLMAAGMLWWQALLTITLGNLIVLVPMLLNAWVGVRYGIPFPVFVRAAFGTEGAKVAAMARGLVGCGWFGIQTWLGGLALSALLAHFWTAWPGISGHEYLAFGTFWLVQMAIVSRGMGAIKRFESGAAPILLLLLLTLMIWALSIGPGFLATLQASTRLSTSSSYTFWELFWPGLAANVGNWATLSLNIPDFTRYAKSQRAQLIGQSIGLPLGMMGTSFVGLFVTATALDVFHQTLWNPIELIPHITHNGLLLLLALGVILLAQTSINMGANVVSPSNDFSNLAPRWISFRLGGLITGIVGILMCPWLLMEHAGAYIFTWLAGYGSLLGAIAGVMIADYWLWRRQHLTLAELYRVPSLYGRWNWPAFVAMAVAIVPLIPGFLVAAETPGGIVKNPNFLDRIYTYGWLWTFAVAGLGYVILQLGRRHQALRRQYV